MSDPTTTGSAIPGLEPFPDKGRPKGERLKDAVSLQGIFDQFKLDDTISARQRTGIRAMVDGQPPYREAALRRAGAANRSNLNFGEAKSRLSQSLTSYNDLLESLPVFIEPEIPLPLMDDANRIMAQDVIAEAFTTMMRDWPDCDFRWQLLSKEFVENGVGLAYFPDDIDWRYDAVGWDGFLIPRGTKASEKFIDVLLIEKTELPSDLYRKILNEKAAEEIGWNPKAVKKALVRATRYGKKAVPSNWGAAWAEVQSSAKNNDTFWNHENNTRIYTVHGYIKEYDGTWSHYIIERDPHRDDAEGPQFLYQQKKTDKEANNFFTTFCLNVGNGTYHSIRGQGFDMYPFIQTLNKTRNAELDNLTLAMKILMQPKDSISMDEPPLTMAGPIAILSPEMNYVERQFMDHTRSALPVIQDLTMLLNNVSPTYQARGVSMDRQARTKYEIQANQGLDSVLTTASINMFWRSWRRLLREMFRRVQRICAMQMFDDYPEVYQFLRRCNDMGVPPEVILSVERIYEKRSFGAGSPGQRQAIIDRGMQRLGTLDEAGRSHFLHDAWVADVGVRAAQRYYPSQQKPRPVIDQKLAELENAEMFKGAPIEPLDGENHAVHAMVHLPSIQNSVQLLENWRNEGEQGEITDLQPHIAYLAILIPHTERHVAEMQRDPTRAETAAQAAKALQELAAIWMTYVRQLEKVLKEQEAEASSQEQPDPELVAKLQKQQAELEMTIQKFRLDQQLKVADVEQKMRIRQQEADQRMAAAIQKQVNDMGASDALPPASQANIVTNQGVKTPF